MAQRSTEDPRAVYAQAVRAVVAANRLAHDAWDPSTTDTRLRSIFREFPLRWLVVPLAGVAAAMFVLAVSALAGAAS